VAVQDRGAGISPRERERVFDAYVRLDRDRRCDGLGLGLSICRRIVEAHGGVISVSARDGGGSCFAFLLPTATPATGASMSVAEGPASASAGDESAPERGQS
jgi:signal transduction histidine kinase